MNIERARNAVDRLQRLLADPEEGSRTWSLCLAVAFSDLEIALASRHVCLTLLSPPAPAQEEHTGP